MKWWKVLFPFSIEPSRAPIHSLILPLPYPPSTTPLQQLSNSIDRQSALASVKCVYFVWYSSRSKRYHPPSPLSSHELQISTGDQNVALNLPNTHSATNIGEGRAGGMAGGQGEDRLYWHREYSITYSVFYDGSESRVSFDVPRTNSKQFLMGEPPSRCVCIRSLFQRKAWKASIITRENYSSMWFLQLFVLHREHTIKTYILSNCSGYAVYLFYVHLKEKNNICRLHLVVFNQNLEIS